MRRAAGERLAVANGCEEELWRRRSPGDRHPDKRVLQRAALRAAAEPRVRLRAFWTSGFANEAVRIRLGLRGHMTANVRGYSGERGDLKRSGPVIACRESYTDKTVTISR